MNYVIRNHNISSADLKQYYFGELGDGTPVYDEKQKATVFETIELANDKVIELNKGRIKKHKSEEIKP